jgi:hypothetical protein
MTGVGAGHQETLEDTMGAIHDGNVFFGSVHTSVGDICLPSVLASPSSLDAEKPCVETMH